MAAGSVALVSVLAGCATDSPSTTLDQDQEPAATFDGMSRDANVAGESRRRRCIQRSGDGRSVGDPSHGIEVTVNGESRRYLAFVHVVGSTRALPTEVLHVAAGSDSVGLDHPMASGQRPDPAKFGVSSWKDLVTKQFDVATSGLAMIKQQAGAGSPCPKPSPRATVTCTAVKFGLRVSGDYCGLVNNQRGQLDRSKKVTVSTRAADVNGAVLIID